MKKKLLIIPIIPLLTISCVKQEDFIALQNEMIAMKKEINQLKDNQSELKMKTEDIARRLDDVSNIATKNSLEIQKIKLSYKPSENPPVEGKEKVITPQKPEEIYNKALDLYYEGKLEEAENQLKKFLSKFKENSLYDNALFWLGQIYYSKGDYEKAIETFKTLIDKCNSGQLKDCNKLPITLLKISYAYIKVNKKNEADKYLKKLIEEFPDTEESQIAKRKLEENK